MHSNWHHTIQSFHITTQKKKKTLVELTKKTHTHYLTCTCEDFNSDIWHSREKKS